MIGRGQEAPSGHIPFTPRAKKVLELSLRESQQLGHEYIGTEHILLGLIREGEGVAAQVLVKLGADLNRVRQQVLQLLGGREGEAGAEGETAVTWEADTGLTGEREVRIVGSPAQIAEILARLRSIDARLAAVQRHLVVQALHRGPPTQSTASPHPANTRAVKGAPEGGPRAADCSSQPTAGRSALFLVRTQTATLEAAPPCPEGPVMPDHILASAGDRL
jgi:hypothetical protein